MLIEDDKNLVIGKVRIFGKFGRWRIVILGFLILLPVLVWLAYDFWVIPHSYPLWAYLFVIMIIDLVIYMMGTNNFYIETPVIFDKINHRAIVSPTKISINPSDIFRKSAKALIMGREIKFRDITGIEIEKRRVWYDYLSDYLAYGGSKQFRLRVRLLTGGKEILLYDDKCFEEEIKGITDAISGIGLMVSQ